MSHEPTRFDGTDRTTDRTSDSDGSTSRRTFLKATAAGAAATGVTATGVGTVASEGIPTPFLQRDGNLIRTEDTDEKVILRGVNIADPRRIDSTAPARGKDTEQVIESVTNGTNDWYARLIRLPVHPGDVAKLPPVPEAGVEVHEPITFSQSDLETYCEDHLDQAVQKCKELGVYCIVDYHRHWGEGALEWNDDTLSEEVELFWDFVAARYADEDHVLFEVYNEPTAPNLGGSPIVNQWSQGRWDEWIETCQPWIDTIRDHADNLVLVGSPMWSQYPDGALYREPDADNLAYTYHIYPGHPIGDDNDWDGTIEDGQDQDNGEGVYECYEEVPLFVTEFGWQHDAGAYPTDGTTEDFGAPFHDWLNENPIHWTAWCYDPTWLSAMVERPFETADSTQDSIGDPYSEEIPQYCEDLPCDWVAKPDPDMGEYVRDQLYELRNEDVPTGDGGPTSPTSPGDQWTNEVTETTIEMGWDSVSNADRYNVYLNDTEVDWTGSTTYTFDGLEPDTTYEIGLQSENEAGTSDVEYTTVTTDSTDAQGPCQDLDTIQVDGDTVCNVDGDAYYRDVNGDGSVGNRDVGAFFENFHLEAYDRDEFDYSGNGRVSHGDVVALFDYVI